MKKLIVYSIRVCAVDIAGNESSIFVQKTELDRKAPENVTMTAEGEHFAVAVSAESDAGDVDHYVLERREGGESSWTLISQFDGKYTDEAVVPGTTYVYRVTAVDTAGNVSEGAEAAAVPDAVDTVAPTASLPENYMSYPGMEIRFDGGDSFDNVGITEYIWSFGDGKTATPIFDSLKDKNMFGCKVFMLSSMVLEEPRIPACYPKYTYILNFL